ncbi:MAG: Vitamin B12 dependent methionine synthase activation subunit [Ruminococcaceae bacterium]|nr:Vitamin B12 dependent methionine synthase activation subunit [Oscillospiraceae bacterium]
MENEIFIKTFELCEPDKKEILRYMGAKEQSREVLSVINEALLLTRGRLSPRVCYMILPYLENGDFSCFKLSSKKLEENLKGCRQVILFAATVGSELDRLTVKYGKISPLTALALQAIGAERIEALCDAFVYEMKKQYNLRPRFSPGYGDLALESQQTLFDILRPQTKIGLTLNSSLVMSPSKSVTAIIGISDEPCSDKKNCGHCNKKDCEYRREL